MVALPVKRFTDEGGHHKWHLEMLYAFDGGRLHDKSPLLRYFWLNWHRRARKTTLALNLLIRECCRNPRSIYDFVAPTYKQAKSIIWQDPDMLDSFLPDRNVFGWDKNSTDLMVRFENKSILKLKGADNPDSLRGPRANGVWFDEWALMEAAGIMAIYQPILAEDRNRWAGFSFTPKGCNHAKEGIEKAENNPNCFVSTLPADISGIFTPEELEEARLAMPPELFQQEFMCSFIAEEEMTFITSASLEALRHLIRIEDKPRTFISVDPATGGDECVAKVFCSTKELEQKIYHLPDEMKIVAELQVLAMTHGTKNFVIESVGLGGGIASRLRQLGFNVFDFEPGSKALDSDHFANLKAEMWWEVSKMVRNGKCDYPEDMKTRQQLSSVKYKVQSNSGKLICEPKDLTKKRLGNSPDRADAWVIAMYHMNYFEPDNIKISRGNVPSFVSLGVA